MKTLITGEISFEENPNFAHIQSVASIISYESSADLNQAIDAMEKKGMDWVVPEEYDGKIRHFRGFNHV